MRKLWVLSLVILACKQQKNRTAVAPTAVDSFTRQITNRYEYYNQLGLLDSSGYLLDALKDTVHKLNYGRLTLRWNSEKVQQNIMENEFDSASFFMKNALLLLSSKGIRHTDSFNTYIVYQDLLKKQKLYDSAIRIANEAYYLTLRKDSARLPTICIELADTYGLINDVPNMKKYSLVAWKNKEKEPELTHDIAQLITYCYDQENKIDSAIYYVKEMQGNPGPFNSQPGIGASVYESLGALLIKKGRLQEGLQYQLKAKKVFDSLGTRDGFVFNNLADAYRLTGELDKAFLYIDSAILLASNEMDYRVLNLAWETKSEIYLNNLQYRQAYAALDSSYAYYQQQVDSSLRKHARELETKYSVREKDNQIKSLAFANKANLKIRNQQRLIILVMFVAILLIGIIVLLLWRRRQIRMQLRETILKQRILRARLDPHFIGNSLNTLKNLIRTGITEKALTYVNNLSKLMRFSFENASENYVLLQDEMESLESYLKLQELYRPGLFDYRLEIYPGYEEDAVYIPPMLLQPVVENAIHHGFSNIDYKGMLLIKVEKGNRTLHCIIEDNGKGLKETGPNKQNHSTEINRERLSILSKQTGRTATLKVIDKNKPDEKGTIVEIEIPFRFSKGVTETLAY